ISEKEMDKLLHEEGEKIYKKLKALMEKNEGTIWKNRDFRIDAVPTKDRSKVKNWNLQVNGNPESEAAKTLKERKGTHAKLFRDTFDLGDAPDYETWKESILERYS
ncbi:hypothetical protein K469DRAFT_603485, partial [Zopfia rhizophila CBS 207.26]